MGDFSAKVGLDHISWGNVFVPMAFKKLTAMYFAFSLNLNT